MTSRGLQLLVRISGLGDQQSAVIINKKRPVNPGRFVA